MPGNELKTVNKAENHARSAIIPLYRQCNSQIMNSKQKKKRQTNNYLKTSGEGRKGIDQANTFSALTSGIPRCLCGLAY